MMQTWWLSYPIMPDSSSQLRGWAKRANNLFSIRQVTGGDIYVGYDRTLHKFWVVVINSVYSPETKPPDQGRGQERLWRRLVEYQVLYNFIQMSWLITQAYNDRVLELLTRLGNHVRILFRLSCVPSVKENPASRLNDYFRDELSSEKDPDSCYYLYEKSAMLYGLFIEGSWQFGLKVGWILQIKLLLFFAGPLITQWSPSWSSIPEGAKSCSHSC